MAQVPSYLRAKGRGRGRGSYTSGTENTRDAAAPGTLPFLWSNENILERDDENHLHAYLCFNYANYF